MTDSPINLRADVSPTCRGSTGPWHNGWNPAPLVPPFRIVFQSATLAPDSSGVDIHGWNPDWSAQPTNARTCGVAHALYRLIVPHPRSSWPWRGLPDRSARRHGWSPDSLLSSPHPAVGRVRRGCRFRNRKLGLLASSSPAAGGEGTSFPASHHLGSGSHVRPCSEGRIASGGGSFAPASRFGPRRCLGVVLLGCGRRGSSSSDCCSASHLAHHRPAEGGRGTPRRRSNRLRPVCPALHDHARRLICIGACRFTNVPFSSFGGSRS